MGLVVKSVEAPMRAKSLSVGLSTYERGIEITYQIDEDFRGRVSFEFPVPFTADQAIMSTIGLWGSIFLGQLCLAQEIELQFPVVEGMIEHLEPVIASLYDVRCYIDHIPLVDMPTIRADSIPYAPSSHKRRDNKRACALWSGGTDSTLALILLANNGYERIPVDFSANVDVAEIERSAVDELADQLGLSVQHVKLEFPNFIPIATRYSNYIARPPLENSIPHGRELLLIAPTLVLAKQFNATNVSLGHENEVWTARVTHQGRVLWRWDTQSEAMTVVLNGFVSKYLKSPIRIFSPVASFTDFRKFTFLLVEYPDLLLKMSSCYWDRWCGECPKCVRYYLYQRALGESLISFQHDPVKEQNPYLESYVYSWQNRELTYWADIQHALYTIAKNEELGLEPLLKDYKDAVYPAIGKEMTAIREKVLGIYAAKLLPQDWDSSLVGRSLPSQTHRIWQAGYAGYDGPRQD